MIGTSEQDTFIREHPYSVVTTLRADGSPSSSVVFTLADADRLFFSTTRDRLKAITVARDPRVAITFLDDGRPYRFVTVEGSATIQEADIVAPHVTLNKWMRGDGFEPPADFADILARQGRVVVWVTPVRVSGVTQR